MRLIEPTMKRRSEAYERLRGLLFDKDGTLLDYAASWIPINRRAADLASDGDAALAAHLLRVGGADPDRSRPTACSPPDQPQRLPRHGLPQARPTRPPA
jgi:hypothetical protein